jgi:hypothetical protein
MAQTSRQYIQRLQIIHGAQITMIIIFNLIAYMSRPPLATDNDMLLYVFAGLLVLGMLGSRFIFQTLIAKANAETTLTAKLTKYLTAFIVRLAFLEVPGFFAAVIILITGKPIALIGTAGVLLLFFLVRPSVDLLKRELVLTPNERARVEDPEGIVME